MGIIAGLLRLREDQEATTLSSPSFFSLPLSLAHDILPWRFWGATTIPLVANAKLRESQEKQWAWRVDIISGLFCSLVYGVCFMPQTVLSWCSRNICFNIIQVLFFFTTRKAFQKKSYSNFKIVSN